MGISIILQAVQRERVELAARWLGQFTVNRAAAGRIPVMLDDDLVPALLDEVVALLGSEVSQSIPRRHHADAFARLAEFPENVAVCIDIFQAGTQVLGSFAVENTGPLAAWGRRTRNRFLGELDAVFHVLAHREIEALCERCLSVDPARTPACPAESAHALIDLPAPPRAANLRN